MNSLVAEICRTHKIAKIGFICCKGDEERPITQQDVQDEVLDSIQWLDENAEHRKSINYNFTSYWLKHRVEKFSRNHYVSNGSLIVAAILLGYAFKSRGHNAFFNMKLKKRWVVS